MLTVRETWKTPVRGICQKMSDVSLATTAKTPNSAGRMSSFMTQKTPNIKVNGAYNKSKGLKKRDITPSRNPNFTGIGEGDRFIPNRSNSQFELANHLIVNHGCQDSCSLNESTSAPTSPKKAEKDMKIQLMRAKSSNDVGGCEDRILCYKKGQAPAPPMGYLYHPKVIYSCNTINPATSVKKGIRYIPSTPERILDAPDFRDDYYLNLIHWGRDNIIAVALANSVYLWNAGTGEIDTLFEFPDAEKYITSVQWANEGTFLAVGTSDGQVKLFDPTRRDANAALRTMQSQITEVDCMAWREHVLTEGCKSGRIYHHDVRIATHQIGRFEAHTQAVCGLHWSRDGQYLASGGGDNIANVWQASAISEDEAVPLYVFDDHLASVKVRFNPLHANSLATIGGTTDRTIKFYNVATGTLCHSVETDSQVNAILFNTFYNEVITAHGYPNNVLKIWKYPSMRCVQELKGHTERILGMAMSPCSQFVMSASSDESLRLWHCFKVDKSAKRNATAKSFRFSQSIR